MLVPAYLLAVVDAIASNTFLVTLQYMLVNFLINLNTINDGKSLMVKTNGQHT